MTLLACTFLSVLIYFPGLSTWADIFIVPKDFVISAMSTLCAFSLYSAWLKGRRIALPLLLSVGIYVAFCLLSLKNAVSWHLVLKQTYFDLMGFSFFWFVVNTVKHDRVKVMLEIIILIVTASASFALMGFNIGQRWSATMGNPEYMAGLTTLAIGASISLLSSSWLFILVLMSHLFFAQARSAVFGLALGILIILFLRNSIKHFFIATGLLIILFLVLFKTGIFGSQWMSLDISSRLQVYRASAAHAMKYPVFGIGRGNFQLHSYSFVYNYGGADFHTYYSRLHNDYLQLWLEAGPIAFGIWLFILWRILWPIPPSLLGIGLFIGLIAALFRAIFLFPFQLGPDVAYFWIVAGLYWVVKNEPARFV